MLSHKAESRRVVVVYGRRSRLSTTTLGYEKKRFQVNAISHRRTTDWILGKGARTLLNLVRKNDVFKKRHFIFGIPRSYVNRTRTPSSISAQHVRPEPYSTRGFFSGFLSSIDSELRTPRTVRFVDHQFTRFKSIFTFRIFQLFFVFFTLQRLWIYHR